ncbi:MAG TPA: hypothetical protein VGL62_09250 [Vicinamibacterales bacterium]|jgi:hypothetical protein
MDVQSWLTLARADADARGLPALTPLLESLARSTQALRDADVEFQHPGTRDQGQEATDKGPGTASSDEDGVTGGARR